MLAGHSPIEASVIFDPAQRKPSTRTDRALRAAVHADPCTSSRESYRAHRMASTHSIADSSFAGPVLAFGVIGAIVLIALAFWYFSATQRAKRALAAVRPTPLSLLMDGEIGKVVGTVALAGRSLEAPLSHRVCAHYEVLVQQYRSSGKSGGWHTVIHEFRSCDFFVQDGADAARVDMTNARVVNVMDVGLRSGTFDDAPPEIEAFLASRGASSKGWLFNKKLRYTEGALEPGESVAVLGILGSEASSDSSQAGEGHRAFKGRRVLRAPPDGDLIVSDDPRMEA